MSIYQLMGYLWADAEWAILGGAKQDAYQMNQMLMRLRSERIKYIIYMPGRTYSIRG